MFFANREHFALHIFRDASIGGLPMLVQTIVGESMRDMTDPHTSLPKPKNKIDIAAIKKFLVLIRAQSVVNALLHE